MNYNLFRPSPAIRAAYELRQRVEEIHSLARYLCGRPDGPTPPAIATKAAAPTGAPLPGREENREADTKSVAVKSGAESSPPVASETTVVPPGAAVASGTPAAVISSPASPRERVTLPPVVDVRPELAAFTAAVNQQQQATVQTLQQVTLYCQQQHAQMERLGQELWNLKLQFKNLAQRP